MNEIAKFRAKVFKTETWIYRQPFHIRGTWYMYNSLWDKVQIDHRTLGQSIGLQDKNGRGIYEGDICEYQDGEFSFRAVVARNYWNWYLQGLDPVDCFDLASHSDGDKTDLVVVGNIHDNPKLLEVAQ